MNTTTDMNFYNNLFAPAQPITSTLNLGASTGGTLGFATSATGAYTGTASASPRVSSGGGGANPLVGLAQAAANGIMGIVDANRNLKTAKNNAASLLEATEDQINQMWAAQRANEASNRVYIANSGLTSGSFADVMRQDMTETYDTSNLMMAHAEEQAREMIKQAKRAKKSAVAGAALNTGASLLGFL